MNQDNFWYTPEFIANVKANTIITVSAADAERYERGRKCRQGNVRLLLETLGYAIRDAWHTFRTGEYD